MSIIKRLIQFVVVLIIIGLLFRGCLYRQFVCYESIGVRQSYTATNPALLNYIDSHVEINNTDISIDAIIKQSLSLTTQQLHFTANKNDNAPNKLMGSRAAHCVGYAAFFATTCNYLLKKYKLDQTWIAEAQIGQLYLFGINVHHFFQSAFFKDHDFVLIENKQIHEVLAVDPSVNDYCAIDYVRYSKK